MQQNNNVPSDFEKKRNNLLSKIQSRYMEPAKNKLNEEDHLDKEA